MQRGAAAAAGADAADARFVADAASALGATLNLRRTVERAASLAVPRLADAALVLVAGALGFTGAAAIADAAGRSRVVTVEPLRPVPPDAESPARLASRELTALLGTEPAIAEAWPLRVRGMTIGAIALARCHGGEMSTDADWARDRVTAVEVVQCVARAVDAALLYAERTALATTLRSALLPPALPVVPGMRVGSSYRAAYEATQIGGDFYDLYPVDDEWAFVIGDVCGKGVDAAVLTGQVRQSLRTADLAARQPSQALDLLNRAMLQMKAGKYVTLVHGRIAVEPERLRIVMAGGGHPPPLILRADGLVERVEIGGTIAGALTTARFADVEVVLERGEKLLLYTDGVTEARVAGQELGIAAVATALADSAMLPVQAIVERIEELTLEFVGGHPHDDIAMLALEADPDAGS